MVQEYNCSAIAKHYDKDDLITLSKKADELSRLISDFNNSLGRKSGTISRFLKEQEENLAGLSNAASIAILIKEGKKLYKVDLGDGRTAVLYDDDDGILEVAAVKAR